MFTCYFWRFIIFSEVAPQTCLGACVLKWRWDLPPVCQIYCMCSCCQNSARLSGQAGTKYSTANCSILVAFCVWFLLHSCEGRGSQTPPAIWVTSGTITWWSWGFILILGGRERPVHGPTPAEVTWKLSIYFTGLWARPYLSYSSQMIYEAISAAALKELDEHFAS